MPQFNLDQQDFISAQMLHTKVTRRQVLIWGACLVVSATLMLFLQRIPWLLVPCAGIFGGLIGALFTKTVYRWLFLPRRSAKLFQQQKSLRHEITYTWDAQNLRVENERGQGTIPWADYLKWRENERLFLLYQSDVLFNVLPKRIFAHGSDLDAFRTILLANIGASR
jgi:YcxB-like protein